MERTTTPRELMRQFTAGAIGRRDFVRRATALGFSASAIAGFLAACGGTSTATTAPAASTAPVTATTASSSTTTTAATTTAAGGASSTAGAQATRPAGTAASGGAAPATGGGGLGSASKGPFGTGGGLGPGATKRGGGGTLKILYWQAPTTFNPHLNQGTKDSDIARVVYEPLADYGPDDTLVPFLADGIPSLDNGQVAKDGKSVTWKLKSGVKWSDGQPFTAKDVVFTWQYVTNEKTAAVTIENFNGVEKVEAIDDTTVKISFKEPTPGWYIPFVGYYGLIIPEHIFKEGIGESAKNFAGNLKPVGTGPYRATNFAPGDSASLEINPNWRDANGPFFDKIEWKGGGDAVSAARAVLQTGDYNIAWNLQIEQSVLNQLTGSGAKGKVGFQNGFGVERIYINLTDPNKEIDGERSSVKAPHPFFADKAVRQAFTLAADRKTIAEVLYGPAGDPTAAFLNSPESLTNKDLPWEFNLDKAGKALDAAGWTKSGQYRAKGGVPMKVLFQTTINTLRQKEQELIKDSLEKLGVQTELKSIDSGVYFSSDAGNPDTAAHFYADLEMLTTNPDTPDPQAFFGAFTTAQIPSKANGWGFGNTPRYQNPEYDKLVAQSKSEMDPV
ncbi:MAG TPA: peptide ABC transporter substrate-binding protein, partial [Thermomicrobiales bacterium]